MNELEYFYKEAGSLENVINYVKNMMGVQNPIKVAPSSSPETQGASGFVQQKEETSIDQNSGKEVKNYESDPTINFVSQNLQKEFGEILSHLGNVTSDSISNALKHINDIGSKKIEDLIKDPEQLKKLNENYNIVANIMPVLKRVSEIFAHEMEHLNSGDNEPLHSEDQAQAKEQEGSKELLQTLKSKYPNLDQKIKDIQDFLEQLGNISGQLKTAKYNSKSYGFNVRSSIINKDVSSLIKISNILDENQMFVAADLIDSIIEEII